MPYWLIDILSITGAMALFVYGMKVLSDGVQKAASGPLRQTLGRITKRPFHGILAGLFATAIIQSSSATTVMTISFVNAKLITVYQSIGLIMGANIGTTVTAWLVSLGGFVFKLSYVTLPILTIAIPFYLRSSKKHQYWSQALIGFCIIFIGLDFLNQAIPAPETLGFLDSIKNLANPGFAFQVLFVFVGIILTILVQSSSAAITLTMSLIFSKLIPLELGLAMILGENIGTCLTAEIAALIGNRQARQSATIHTMFNVVGALWMIWILDPFSNLLEYVFDLFTGSTDSFDDPRLATAGAAAFHSSFNIINTLILYSFIPQLESIAQRLRSTAHRSHTSHIRYFDSAVPELTSVELRSELNKFAQVVDTMIRSSKTLLNTIEQDDQLEMIERLIDQSKKNNQYESALSRYIVKLVKSELTEKTSDLVQKYISISSDLHRLSNLVSTISYEYRDKIFKNNWFTFQQRMNLNLMYDKILEGLDLMKTSLESDENESINISSAELIETHINEMRDQYRAEIPDTTDDFDFNIESTLIYFRMVTLLEKIGDKIYDIERTLSKNYKTKVESNDFAHIQ